MSLILDALNRARAEPADDRAVPGLNSQHCPPAEPVAVGRQYALAAALLLALLVIAGLLWRQFAVSPLPPPPPAMPEVAPVSTPTAAPAPAAPAPAEAAPPQRPVPEREVVALYQPQLTAPAVRDQEVQEAEVGEAEAAAATVDSLVEAAQQTLADVRLRQHATPFLAALSQQRKDAIPTLMYLQHDYREGGSSSVTINGNRAAAGDSVGGGVTVREILPDSVVLSHEGEQFRLRALNSWVNL